MIIAKQDLAPIHTLLMEDCQGCYRDFSQNKENCFALRYSDRIWYMYPESEQDLDEWIKLIKWKLEYVKVRLFFFNNLLSKQIFYAESLKNDD